MPHVLHNNKKLLQMSHKENVRLHLTVNPNNYILSLGLGFRLESGLSPFLQ